MGKPMCTDITRTRQRRVARVGRKNESLGGLRRFRIATPPARMSGSCHQHRYLAAAAAAATASADTSGRQSNQQLGEHEQAAASVMVGAGGGYTQGPVRGGAQPPPPKSWLGPQKFSRTLDTLWSTDSQKNL